MLSSDYCIVHAKLDLSSRDFIKSFADNSNMSVIELTGAIIRKFIYDFSKGSNEYTRLNEFVLKNKNLKEVSK